MTYVAKTLSIQDQFKFLLNEFAPFLMVFTLINLALVESTNYVLFGLLLALVTGWTLIFDTLYKYVFLIKDIYPPADARKFIGTVASIMMAMGVSLLLVTQISGMIGVFISIIVGYLAYLLAGKKTSKRQNLDVLVSMKEFGYMLIGVTLAVHSLEMFSNLSNMNLAGIFIILAGGLLLSGKLNFKLMGVRIDLLAYSSLITAGLFLVAGSFVDYFGAMISVIVVILLEFFLRFSKK